MRYVTALREGGSVPAVVEADDGALYVVKFRAAAQGGRALAAEIIVGELARAAGLRVPELALIDVDAALGRSEPHQEIQELLIASAGVNLAMGYLAGAVGYDVAARRPVAGDLASAIVALDVFAANVDRTAKNPNLLWQAGALWLIDHGAALYFHHAWQQWQEKAMQPFELVKNHVLLSQATRIEEVDTQLRLILTDQLIENIVSMVPDEWLGIDSPFETAAEHRSGYEAFLKTRVAHSHIFVKEAQNARAGLI